jgi:hypothetical protein
MPSAFSLDRNFFSRAGENEASRETTVEECAQLVRRAAAPAEIGERTGTQIERAALRLGMTANQVKKLWYRERRAIEHHEYVRIQSIVARLEGRRALRRELRAEINDRLRAVDERAAGPLVGLARKPSLEPD